MYISWLRIEGFRNFVNETINFADKTLVIGTNDVGKTNMIYALRLLFDKSLSERDLELSNSDYNAYTSATTIKITVCIKDIKEDCLRSTFNGDIQNDSMIIQYQNSKNGEFAIYTGATEELLQAKAGRFYLKRLNLEYVNSNRDILSFMKRTKLQLLDRSKENLLEAQKTSDAITVQALQDDLKAMNDKIDNLEYIQASLSKVNDELASLAFNNEDQLVKFTTGNNEVEDLLNNLDLAYSTSKGNLKIGGDGRNNQIYLATWVAKQKFDKSLERVTIFAIEEPEAHLHPHQQRKLSKYLAENFTEQIFITTHSSQIAAEFRPDKIVRLYSQSKCTKVAQGGCAKNIGLSFDEFGYRLNAISSEVFFSDAVFLVEGPSEKLFYTALSQDLGIDFDRYNITLLDVNGIGFKPYIKICKALDIPFVIRTDDDIFEKSYKKRGTYKYYGGISRVMGIYEELLSNCQTEELYRYWEENKQYNEWEANEVACPQETRNLNKTIREKIDLYNIFLSVKDLENDIVATSLYQSLSDHYGTKVPEEIVKKMQGKKAEHMLEYLNNIRKLGVSLECIKDDAIAKPIIRLKSLVEGRIRDSEEQGRAN
ncbi:ATP-dependent endonuclease [Sporanaerobium hydrogeniformans]|uniref:ATP-dependent endonuclease n=1 Tax=Sporanaerobium hydrogeniformans TaxID=3072179 RepID=A0AC61DAK2_9FIRM|nr:AAA family ATPase [Sporanaerobium hydrogeniformans]PHV69592.1 ATP-dependent endonuclease [Sporanaerobium hydrogeniformans]